jgi:hypothetical protein
LDNEGSTGHVAEVGEVSIISGLGASVSSSMDAEATEMDDGPSVRDRL